MKVVGKSQQVWKTNDFIKALFEDVHVREAVDGDDGAVCDALAEVVKWMSELKPVLRFRVGSRADYLFADCGDNINLSFLRKEPALSSLLEGLKALCVLW